MNQLTANVPLSTTLLEYFADHLEWNRLGRVVIEIALRNFLPVATRTKIGQGHNVGAECGLLTAFSLPAFLDSYCRNFLVALNPSNPGRNMSMKTASYGYNLRTIVSTVKNVMVHFERKRCKNCKLISLSSTAKIHNPPSECSMLVGIAMISAEVLPLPDFLICPLYGYMLEDERALWERSLLFQKTSLSSFPSAASMVCSTGVFESE